MVRVFHEGDGVVLDLTDRRDYVALTCGQAEELAQALRANAVLAKAGPPALVRGEAWGCKVVSYDRRVGVRFFPPAGATCRRVPLTPAAAGALADELDFKRGQATYGMRFEFRAPAT